MRALACVLFCCTFFFSTLKAPYFKKAEFYQDAVHEASVSKYAASCVLVLNTSEHKPMLGSGVVLDGGRHVLTSWGGVFSETPENLRVIYKSEISGFRSNYYQPSRLLASNHPHLRCVISMSPLGNFLSKKMPLRIIPSPQENFHALKQEKQKAWNFLESLYDQGIRPCGSTLVMHALHGPDFVVLTLDEPIPDVRPWLSEVVNVLPKTLDQSYLIGYSAFSSSCEKSEKTLFYSSQKKNSAGQILRMAVHLPAVFVSETPKTNRQFKNEKIASATFKGTYWDQHFDIESPAPNHQGKPSAMMRGGFVIYKTPKEKEIPAGLFTSELIFSAGSAAQMEKFQNDPALSQIFQKEELHKGWPQHHVIDILTPCIGKKIQKIIHQQNAFLPFLKTPCILPKDLSPLPGRRKTGLRVPPLHMTPPNQPVPQPRKKKNCTCSKQCKDLICL